MSREERRHRILLARPAVAWILAAAQILALAMSVLLLAWSGIWSTPEIAVPGVMAFAAVGALIASQRVHNRLGWLLLLAPLPVTLNVLVVEYADLSVLHHLSLPFVRTAQWVVNWAWTPFVGSFPAILVRFPEGRVPRRWRFIDWLAIGSTILLATGLAISSGGAGDNVFLAAPVESAGGALVVTGLVLLAVGMVSAATSLTRRYRRGDRKLRSQLKWILLAAIVVALTSVYMAVVEVAFRVPFGVAMEPSTVALALIPLAIGIAVLRHQLFDIDFIISRTLVYLILTGLLGGLYITGIELIQRLFVIYTGQTSDAPIVITAFIVATAFTPLQKWVDSLVERRFGGRDAAAQVEALNASMQSVVRMIDPQRMASWLVGELVSSFEAEGAALYLDGSGVSRPFQSRGRIIGRPAVEIVVGCDARDLGRLLLGRRRGGVEYSRREIEALKSVTASLAEALELAADLGHLAPARSSAEGVKSHAATRLGGTGFRGG